MPNAVCIVNFEIQIWRKCTVAGALQHSSRMLFIGCKISGFLNCVHVHTHAQCYDDDWKCFKVKLNRANDHEKNFCVMSPCVRDDSVELVSACLSPVLPPLLPPVLPPLLSPLLLPLLPLLRACTLHIHVQRHKLLSAEGQILQCEAKINFT